MGIAMDREITSASELEHAVHTVTILFSDVVGFSALTERLGDVRAYEAMQRHHRTIRSRIAAHGGEEVELRGDSFFVVFHSSRDALGCARDMQRGLEHEAAQHPGGEVRVRVGLHTGHVIRAGRGYFGRDVIVAARISALAGAGQILISSQLADPLPGDMKVGAQQRVRLKGLSGVHLVSELRWRTAADQGGRRAIAAVASA